MAIDQQEGIPTILRGLVMLEQVALAQRPVPAAEIIEKLGLPKPTVNGPWLASPSGALRPR